MPRKNAQKAADPRRPKAPALARDDKALQNFFKHLDLDLFRHMILTAPPDSKFGRIATILDDPRYATKPLPLLTRQLGISLVDLVEGYAETALAVAHMASLHRLPEVVAENAVDALPTKVTCPDCGGHKRVDDPTGKVNKVGNPMRVRCPNCAGLGMVRRPGETDAKKLMFQHEKLIGDGGQRVSVGVNVGLAIPSLMDAVDVQERALKLESRVVEAKVVTDG